MEDERDEFGHVWGIIRCKRCGVYKIWHHAKEECPGERHSFLQEDDDFTPSIPMGIYGSNPSLSTGVILDTTPSQVIEDAGPTFESTAFQGGESGGGGGGADWSGNDTSSPDTSMTAEAPSDTFDAGSFDSGGSSFTDSGGGGGSDFGSGGGTDSF